MSEEAITVNGDEITREMNHGKGDKCLDFHTGQVLPAMECPWDETGDGRLALQRGKRYIRIPRANELRDRFEDAMNEQDRLDRVRFPGHQEWNKIAAEVGAALRWLASLQPAVKLGWLEEGMGVVLVYDPDRKEWE
jgi:hypothetical protein